MAFISSPSTHKAAAQDSNNHLLFRPTDPKLLQMNLTPTWRRAVPKVLRYLESFRHGNAGKDCIFFPLRLQKQGLCLTKALNSAQMWHTNEVGMEEVLMS